ncbi:hypothetical protein Q9L58_010362 [Maublancomyces gigas]|uniref:Uncharacterized protein n=1 Tax=Discina gigas TaxID=1032678 RepID=A0ABR3G4P7_9PEZI
MISTNTSSTNILPDPYSRKTRLYSTWTKVSTTKKTRYTNLYSSYYTIFQIVLIVEQSSPIPPGVTDKAFLTTTYKAQASTEVKLTLACLPTRGNILLLTCLTIAAFSAQAYIPYLFSTLTPLGWKSSHIQTHSRWKQFLLHSVPTKTTPQQKTEEIRELYLSLPAISPTPSWLTIPFSRTVKTMLMMDGCTKVSKTKLLPTPIVKPDFTDVPQEFIGELSSPIRTVRIDYTIITTANATLASTTVNTSTAHRTSRGNILLLPRSTITARGTEVSILSLAAPLNTLRCRCSTIRTNLR